MALIEPTTWWPHQVHFGSRACTGSAWSWHRRRSNGRISKSCCLLTHAQVGHCRSVLDRLTYLDLFRVQTATRTDRRRRSERVRFSPSGEAAQQRKPRSARRDAKGRERGAGGEKGRNRTAWNSETRSNHCGCYLLPRRANSHGSDVHTWIVGD